MIDINELSNRIKNSKAFIFDLDGTLLNTIDDLAVACNYALAQMNFPERSLEEIRAFIGNGVPKLLERALPDEVLFTKDLANKLLEHFNIYYMEHLTDYTFPYDGINDVLEYLKEKDKILMVFTNKIEPAAKEIINYFFPNTFAVVAGDHEDWPLKPSIDRYIYILNKFDIKAEEAVIVGDSDTDVRTAYNANSLGIGANWGYKSADILIENYASILINNPFELLELIRDFS